MSETPSGAEPPVVDDPSAAAEPRTLEERIAYLEEMNEGMKRVGFLLVILLCVMAGTMVYQHSAMTSGVQTDGLIISDSGRLRGAVTAMPNGHLGMVFYDLEGNLPGSVQHNLVPYLDGLVIYDRQGNPRLLLGVDEQGDPVLDALSSEGQPIFSAVPRRASPNPGEPAPTPAPAPAP